MARAPNPFDDDADQPPPVSRRRRRPWWRWNVITLAVALFAVVWVRHFANIGPGATWLAVLTIFAAWALAPALAVPTVVTTMPQRDSSPGDEDRLRRESWWRRNRLLAILRGLAIVFMLLSLMHLGQSLYWFVSYSPMMRGRSGSNWFGWGYRPMLEFFFSATLYVISEIALRLDRGDGP